MLADLCVQSGSRSERECQELALWPGRPQGTCNARRPPDLETGAVSWTHAQQVREGQLEEQVLGAKGQAGPGVAQALASTTSPSRLRAQGRWGDRMRSLAL